MNPNLREVGVVTLATPCSMPWSQMTGDERTRHCARCRLNVYNVENLSADEVRALVTKGEGRTCFRFKVRKDGTLLTSDCPVGVAALKRRMYLGFAATVLFVTGFVGTLLSALGANGKAECDAPGVTSNSTIGRIVQKLDRKANVIRTLLPGTESHVAGGMVAVPYVPPTPPSNEK